MKGLKNKIWALLPGFIFVLFSNFTQIKCLSVEEENNLLQTMLKEEREANAARMKYYEKTSCDYSWWKCF